MKTFMPVLVGVIAISCCSSCQSLISSAIDDAFEKRREKRREKFYRKKQGASPEEARRMVFEDKVWGTL